MKEKKKKIPYYDYFSLYKIINPPSGIANIFIFDDINSFIENFHFDNIINYPARLGMIACIMCKKGFVKVRIDLDDYTIMPGMIMIIFPERIFQVIEVSADYEAGYFLLEKVFFDVQNDLKMALDIESFFFKQPCIQLSESDTDEVAVIFDNIKRKTEENTSLFLKEIVQTYIRVLFYIVCNTILNSKREVVKTRKEEVFEHFISILEQNFRKEKKFRKTQNITWYAEKLCLTPKYLSKLVYEASGKHAGEWVKDYIILEAKALLNSSSLTVQQISNELGFSNQSHFGAYFKRYTGASPREYKQGKRQTKA